MEGVAKILDLLHAAATGSSRSKLKNSNQIIDFSVVMRRSPLEEGLVEVGWPVGEKSPGSGPPRALPSLGAGVEERPKLGVAHEERSELGQANDDPAELPAVLDPLTLALALPAAPGRMAAAELTPRADFANAVEELVRRIAWGGDRSSGTARIEFGSGRYRGGIILVHAEGRDVTVELELPSGADGAELGARLRTRLEEKGLSLTEVRIR
jgi:hypothetical protein